jgi:hypothetical protein
LRIQEATRPPEGPLRRADELVTHSRSLRGVVTLDNEAWILYGARRSQPVATNRKWSGRESGSSRRKPLPWVANGCRGKPMVRRGFGGSSPPEGSAKSPQIGAFAVEGVSRILQYAVHVGPFMEPSGSERTLECVENGRNRRKDCRLRRADRNRTGSIRRSTDELRASVRS